MMGGHQCETWSTLYVGLKAEWDVRLCLRVSASIPFCGAADAIPLESALLEDDVIPCSAVLCPLEFNNGVILLFICLDSQAGSYT